MPSIRSKFVSLVSIASRAEKTLKAISRASVSATRLGTGAIYGSLGFSIGAGGTFAALASQSMLMYAPFAVPLVGMCGLLTGVLASRDRTDRANERASNLVEQAWTLRDREVAGLTRQITAARREQSPRLHLIEQKLAFLELAPPERLMAYYGLHNRKPPQGERHAPILGPAEQQILEAWKQPAGGLQDLGTPTNNNALLHNRR